MTLNYLCARFKVIDSLNAEKNGEIYSLVMTPAPCRVAGGARRHSCTYLLTYTVGSGNILKPAISPKWLKIERKLLYKVVHWLSTAAKIYGFE